jgi:hypothetical protein
MAEDTLTQSSSLKAIINRQDESEDDRIRRHVNPNQVKNQESMQAIRHAGFGQQRTTTIDDKQKLKVNNLKTKEALKIKMHWQIYI